MLVNQNFSRFHQKDLTRIPVNSTNHFSTCVTYINFFKVKNFNFSVNLQISLTFLFSLIVFNFPDNSLISSFVVTLSDLGIIRVLASKHSLSCEEKKDGNSDGKQDEKDGICGKEFQILKMPPKARSLARRARNSFRVPWKQRDARHRHRRLRAAPLQKHAINYPGIAASTIPSMLHK